MSKTKELSKRLRPDYYNVVELVECGSRVLDLGCGDGRLLEHLIKEKNARGLGVEIDEENVAECIGRGLSIFQGNIDRGLKNYRDGSYDYVILNQTLQVTHKPDYVLQEMLRVGKKAVVSFPNFAYWKIRARLLFSGRMPKSRLLPFEWYNTPNIHLLSITDFLGLCRERRWTVLKKVFIGGRGNVFSAARNVLPNLFAQEAVFILTKEG